MARVAKRNSDRCPTHPGAVLREDVIPATGRTKAEIAQLLRISRQHLYDILRERKPVSPAVAVRLGKLFGDGAGVWVRMQAAYDTWNAEREEDVSKIPTLRAKAAAIRRVVLKPQAAGPVAIWDGEPKLASIEHDSVDDEPRCSKRRRFSSTAGRGLPSGRGRSG
jgi:addiction module HigA family antidote